MARKIIQIVSDNFLSPSTGQYCGLLALCNDGTIWSGHVQGSVKWRELNAPESKEQNSDSLQQLKAEISALCAEFRELYDGDLGGEAVSLLLTELQKLSAV